LSSLDPGRLYLRCVIDSPLGSNLGTLKAFQLAVKNRREILDEMIVTGVNVNIVEVKLTHS